ncbi:SacI homology domain-containing protein [Paraphysoderma sedebokerense]|nr:SacI homology domain-containing protein [Paraphysoderma sedebokerense]
MPLHQSLNLYVSQENYLIQPTHTDGTVPSQTLVIDRRTGDISVDVSPNPPSPSSDATVIPIQGILGHINLHSPHLIVITSAVKIGSVLQHPIYKITSTQILPILRSRSRLSDEDKRDEDKFLDMLDGVMKEGFMWFSYTYDLTNSLQRIFDQGEQNTELWEKADDRFFWNKYLQSKFIQIAKSSPPDSSNHFLKHFILPIICGFISTTPAQINAHKFTYALISRKSVYRVGTRYHSRGIDEEGNVSNFAETEEIVIIDDNTQLSPTKKSTTHVLSYVQIRGSIPLYWRQRINARYTPILEVMDRPDTHNTFKRHIESNLNKYGESQVLVNLINKKGYELPLGEEFKRQIELLGDQRVKYTHFDFHHECRKMQWHRIQLLLDQLSNDLTHQSYFSAAFVSSPSAPLSPPIFKDVKIHKKQIGVIRTNCIDCLDRTNVVQSMFAKRLLEVMLKDVGVMREGQTVEACSKDFEHIFKNGTCQSFQRFIPVLRCIANQFYFFSPSTFILYLFTFVTSKVWADNADAISTLYSGTGALKTDFTRTGKRTKAGALKDGYNSVIRYIKNNYLDGERQDALDLLLGVYAVGGDEAGKKERYVRVQLDERMERKNNAVIMVRFYS